MLWLRDGPFSQVNPTPWLVQNQTFNYPIASQFDDQPLNKFWRNSPPFPKRQKLPLWLIRAPRRLNKRLWHHPARMSLQSFHWPTEPIHPDLSRPSSSTVPVTKNRSKTIHRASHQYNDAAFCSRCHCPSSWRIHSPLLTIPTFDSLRRQSSLLTSSIFKSSLISKDTHDFLSINKRSGVSGEELA